MRYERNKPIINEAKQHELSQKTVAIVGLGALGGYLAQGAVRVGIGNLILIDGDVFSETNLNRQLFATEETLGLPKVEVAKQALLKINGGVHITTQVMRITDVEDAKYLAGADVILDGLDSIASRRVVQDIAMTLQIPLIHGAIGNWDGQVAFLTPDENRLDRIYDHHLNDDAQEPVANLVVLPMVIAARELALMIQYFIDDDAVEKNTLRRMNVQEYYEIAIDLNSN